MDNEDSDEGTSAGNTTFVNECGVCGAELEKKTFCDGPGSSYSNNLDNLCSKCMQKVLEVNEISTKRLDQVKAMNSKLTYEMIRGMKDLQELRNLSRIRIKEFHLIESLKSQIWALQRDFRDSISVITSKQNEKLQLCEGLNKKQNLLYEHINKLIELESGTKLNVCQPSAEEFLQEENRELLEKIRDFEIESFLYTKEMCEALQAVKGQVLKEKSVIQRRSFVGDQSAAKLAEIGNSLQEDICLTRRKIEALSELFSSSLKTTKL